MWNRHHHSHSRRADGPRRSRRVARLAAEPLEGRVLLDGAGALDPDFEGDGRVILDRQFGIEATDVAVQGDNVLAVGEGTVTGGVGTVFWFDSNGILSNETFLNFDADKIAVRPDGKVVAVGSTTQSITVSLISENGTLERDNRQFYSSLPLNDIQINDVIVTQPDNQIVVAGNARPGFFGTDVIAFVARFNADTSTDFSFGEVNGLAGINFNDSGVDQALGVAQQGDKILVAGVTGQRPTASDDMFVVRLDDNGGFDDTFGDPDLGGGLRIDFDGANDAAAGVAVDPVTGNILVGGHSGGDFAVTRLDADGNLDEDGFGVDGRNTINLGRREVAAGVALQSDGKIVVGGSSIGNNESDFALARFNVDGTIDRGFGDNGGTTTNFGFGISDDFGLGLALQADDKAVIAGTRGSFGTRDVLLARYLADDPDTEPPTVLDIVDVSPDPRAEPVDSIVVRFSEPIVPASLTRADVSLRRNGQAVALPDDLTISPVGNDGDTFRISGLGPVTAEAGTYTLTVDATGVRDPAGNFGIGEATETFRIESDNDNGGGDDGGDDDGNGGASVVEGDFDNDGRTDLVLYRFDSATEEGVFEIRHADGSTRTIRLGGLNSNDIPISGDFDGDGAADAAVLQPTADINGDGAADASRWVIRRSSDGRVIRIDFGAPGTLDRPAPADFDGDGRTDIATFRANSDLVPGAAQWFILPSGPNPGFDSTNGAFSVLFGAAGGTDLPAPADFDGDGRADIATFRPVSDLVPGAAQWFILPSGPNDLRFSQTAGGFPVTFGAAGNADQPVLADFNGDGRAEIATFRSVSDLAPGRAQWFVLSSEGRAPNFGGGFPATFGQAGDIAAVGDHNGDGRPDYAVFDPETGDWTIAPADATGRPGAVDRISFDPTGGSGVPVLSPLFFRLANTGNARPNAARLASASATDASGVGFGSAALRAADGVALYDAQRAERPRSDAKVKAENEADHDRWPRLVDEALDAVFKG